MTQYVYSPRYIDAPVARYQDINGDGDTNDQGDSVLLYTADANFNVTGLINATTSAVVERYAYDPYGKTLYLAPNWTELANRVSAFNNNVLYTGRTLDTETGLFYYRARYYDVNLMRFLGRDPIAADGNLYRYASDSPVVHLDPSGLVDTSFFFDLGIRKADYAVFRLPSGTYQAISITASQRTIEQQEGIVLGNVIYGNGSPGMTLSRLRVTVSFSETINGLCYPRTEVSGIIGALIAPETHLAWTKFESPSFLPGLTIAQKVSQTVRHENDHYLTNKAALSIMLGGLKEAERYPASSETEAIALARVAVIRAQNVWDRAVQHSRDFDTSSLWSGGQYNTHPFNIGFYND